MVSLDIIFKNRSQGELIVRGVPGPDKKAVFVFDKDLDRALLLAIDKLFEKNKIRTLSFKKVKIWGEIRKDSVSYRIAWAVAKGLSL